MVNNGRDRNQEEHVVNVYFECMQEGIVLQVRGLGDGAGASTSLAAGEDGGTREGPGHCLQVRLTDVIIVFLLI